MKITLTDRQRDAVVDALSNRIAALNEFSDALGITRRGAKETVRILNRVRNKLTSREEENVEL